MFQLPRPRVPQLTSAHLVAVAAVVLAMAGSATAASLITGAQIQDNTVTGRDIKDESLTLVDVKPSAAKALKGKRGPAGKQGAKGAKGDTGPRGADGPQGVAGPTGPTGRSLLAPPPSGDLIVGGGILDGFTSGDRSLRGYAQLPFVAATPFLNAGPDRNLWYAPSPNTANTEENGAKCVGTALAPNPVAGTLCVYLIDGESPNIEPEVGQLYAGVAAGADGADSTGFWVYVRSALAGAVQVRYVWAYRAP